MAWAETILYITRDDAEEIRRWIDAEASVGWIVRDLEDGRSTTWKLVDTIGEVRPGTTCIWHKEAGEITVPSGRADAPDAIVRDPYAGWTQTTNVENDAPWFGANLPGPYSFRFNPEGTESPNSIGRSGLHWAGDHYRAIGKPAHPEAKKWWKRLKRFVRSTATPIPWPDVNGRQRAYAFKCAFEEIRAGRQIDVNP